ncbi:UNVERIFIED_CONTAM: Salicylic acid-binding protein 2 [Sesamum calycinum]|uniref:Salicylic acid-binding protein 2 n=1 Tax=Sesamum calycinum TaxID=2727403 RepID=A0AAW2MRQ7_9LAMI
MADAKQQVHIILVHGACHGAWCWYKLKPLLEAAGHRVTALDLAASGIDRRRLEELHTFADYSQPLLELMASIPLEEKVVLVGHSLGGMSLVLAMDMYPQKIKVAVFLAVVMPDSIHKPSYVLNQSVEIKPAVEWLDTEFIPFGSSEENLTSVLLGPPTSPPNFTIYVLLRPCCLFLQDLSNKIAFSKEGFGSVKKVFIVCSQDKTIPLNFQRWQIETIGVDQIKEIENADHMPMLSKPQELCHCLLEIANYYV